MTSLVSVTYNCAKELQSIDQVSQIYHSCLEASPIPPEFIIVNLQEVAPIYNASFGWTKEYLKVFLDAIPAGYRFLTKSVCGAIVCLVLGSETAVEPVCITSEIVKFGLFWSSLKGAVLISLQFENGAFLHIVSAHLAAGEDQVAARNSDFNYLYEILELSRRSGQLLISGDLNYRTLDGTLETDELRTQMSKQAVAKGLHEAEISFSPTYKYRLASHIRTNTRTPSFCDRILFKDFDGSNVHGYFSVDYPFQSDHRPVLLSLSTPLTSEAPMLGIDSVVEPMTDHSSGNLADLVVGSASYLAGSTYGRLGLAFVCILALSWKFI